MMQWSPERQRSPLELVSERIALYRETMTDNRVKWGVCRKSHKSTQTCGHKLSFTTFSFGLTFFELADDQWRDGCFYYIPWGGCWLVAVLRLTIYIEGVLNSEDIMTIGHLQAMNMCIYVQCSYILCFDTCDLNHMLKPCCHLQRPLLQLVYVSANVDYRTFRMKVWNKWDFKPTFLRQFYTSTPPCSPSNIGSRIDMKILYIFDTVSP